MSFASKPVRWGICGTGKIGHDFATAIRQLPDVVLHAVGSRELSTAQEFGKRFGIQRCYGSYEELAVDAEVDVVYVCTPNSEHARNCIMLLQHGRNVLCEKPFTVNRREAEAIVEAAKKANGFCMEGMWTRCMPVMQKLQDLLSHSKIGDVKYLSLHIGFPASSMLDTAKKNKELYARVHKTELGGGAILDVGSYGASFANWILGPQPPTAVSALGELASDGVDTSGAMLLKYGSDKFAQIMMSSHFNTADTALIMGSKGYIEIAAPWQASDKLIVHLKGAKPEEYVFPIREKDGEYSYPHCSLFQHEALHVHEMLRTCKKESSLLSLQESCVVMGILDQVRGQVGVRLENDAAASAPSASEAPPAQKGQQPKEALEAIADK